MKKSDFIALGKAMAQARVKSGSGADYKGFYNAKYALLEMFDKMGAKYEYLDLFETTLKNEIEKLYESEKSEITKMRENQLKEFNGE